MILTLNRGFVEWGEVLDDAVVTTAPHYRPLHHAALLSAYIRFKTLIAPPPPQPPMRCQRPSRKPTPTKPTLSDVTA